MARARHVKLGPFKRWWASRSDSHFQIVTSVSILSVAATLWGFVFLFILGGALDPSKQNLVPFSWGCLFFGGLFAFYILPEFFVYLGQRTVIEDVLLLDSRSEVLRRRGEAEDAAEMLGPVYQARLLGLYQELGIKAGSRFRGVAPVFSSGRISAGPVSDSGDWTDDGRAARVMSDAGAGFVSNWWNTADSRLAGFLPGARALREPAGHRGVLLASAGASILLLWNMFSGLASKGGGTREYTVDLTLWLAGEDSIHAIAPHFDGVGMLLAAVSLTLLYLTTPSAEVTISFTEEE